MHCIILNSVCLVSGHFDNLCWQKLFTQTHPSCNFARTCRGKYMQSCTCRLCIQIFMNDFFLLFEIQQITILTCWHFILYEGFCQQMKPIYLWSFFCQFLSVFLEILVCLLQNLVLPFDKEVIINLNVFLIFETQTWMIINMDIF